MALYSLCDLLKSLITQSFPREMEKLISAQEIVLKTVEDKDRVEVNVAVWKWLQNVEELKGRRMQIEMQADSKRGFFERPLYCVWKFMSFEDLIPNIRDLNNQVKSMSLLVPILPVQVLKPLFSENFEHFKSREEATNQLMKALGDDCIHIAGLYGLRSSGKTKLVKELGEKTKFGVIVFATVSKNPNVRRIQNEIADCLGLRLEDSSEAGGARRILSRLFRHKQVLVILDDVRAKLELEDIGIPYKGDHMGLKVLLTTRSQQVCTLMDCDKEIPLCSLSEDDAWNLFKKHSGIDESDKCSSNLLKVAREVAMECEGLPGKIKDVGSSLRRQPIEEWKATLDSLRHSTARYQVFLSFTGEDSRYTFTGSLYHALCREGFKTFMDDGELEAGDRISLSLVEAIQSSRLSIIVLSENYAYSTWCLDELVAILECKKTKNQLVWPIFYHVEPSDLRHQKNSYGKAMDAHEIKFGKDCERVQKWRSALIEVANLTGDHYTTEYEHNFIQMIVERANNIKNRLYIQSMDMD